MLLGLITYVVIQEHIKINLISVHHLFIFFFSMSTPGQYHCATIHGVATAVGCTSKIISMQIKLD